MAIHQGNKIESTDGFVKEIDAGSMHMALDVLQKFQYQFPQKSTIRELAANAVDSIKERDIAISILKEEAVEGDFYIRRDDPEFRDSNFNPDYFDIKWLSNKKSIDIIYEEGDGINKKDRLRVVDEGVGLGDKRLELYFKLNASTKRNSKAAIGKWGLGAKVGLSTGVDSYRVITRHNGKRFIFDVYSHKVDSVTNKFNNLGEINPTYKFENGYEAYYETTTEKNGTEIIIETKKHHRSIYTDAVRSQLLYFDNINYTVVDESGYSRSMTVKAGVIYSDNDITLSDNNQYSKPHIIINNVCYGYIDFLELDLENKNGNIGIKMEAEEVDISPSRESIIWGDKTRASVTNKFNRVVEIASAEVEKQLNEKDFVVWLRKCNTVLTGYAGNDILGRLSRVVDRSGLKPLFPGDKITRYKQPKELLFGFNAREVYSSQVWKPALGKHVSTISRDELVTWNILNNYTLYYTTGSASNTKDKYLLSKDSRFLLVTIPSEADEVTFRARYDADTKIDVDEEWNKYQVTKARTNHITSLIKSSAVAVNYDDIIVPEDFLKKLEEAEKELEFKAGEDTIAIPEMSLAEKRKLEERTVLSYPEKLGYAQNTNKLIDVNISNTATYQTYHRWTKAEPKIKEVIDWEGTVIYGYQEDEDLLLTAAWILDARLINNDGSNNNKTFLGSDIKLVRISKQIKKYFKNHLHITEFFKQVSEGQLSMNDLFVKWYTGYRINIALDQVKFLNNFMLFNDDIANKYTALRAYEASNYKSLAKFRDQNYLGCTNDAFNAIISFADKATELQLYISNHTDEDVKSKSKEILGEEYTGATGIDLEKYKELLEVVEYAKPLSNILNYLEPLTNPLGKINFELESEIKEIMRNKGYGN